MSAAEDHLSIQLTELQQRRETLTRRIAALDIDIGRELDSERKLILQDRRNELAAEREQVSADFVQMDRQLSGPGSIAASPAPALGSPSSPAAAAPSTASPPEGQNTSGSGEHEPAVSSGNTPPQKPDRGLWLWVLAGIAPIVILCVLFFETVACVLEYRLTEQVANLLGILVTGAALLFALLAVQQRSRISALLGGAALASIVLIIIFLLSPRPAQETCTIKSPVANAQSDLTTATRAPLVTTVMSKETPSAPDIVSPSPSSRSADALSSATTMPPTPDTAPSPTSVQTQTWTPTPTPRGIVFETPTETLSPPEVTSEPTPTQTIEFTSATFITPTISTFEVLDTENVLRSLLSDLNHAYEAALLNIDLKWQILDEYYCGQQADRRRERTREWLTAVFGSKIQATNDDLEIQRIQRIEDGKWKIESVETWCYKGEARPDFSKVETHKYIYWLQPNNESGELPFCILQYETVRLNHAYGCSP